MKHNFIHPLTSAVFDFLVRAAAEGRTVTHGEVAEAIGWHKRAAQGLGPMLDEIFAEDRRLGRPALAAIVVRFDNEFPGKGYFSAVLGFEPNTKTNGAIVGLPPEIDAAWRLNVQQVFAYWQRQFKDEAASASDWLDMAAEAASNAAKELPKQLDSFTFIKYSVKITIERL
jgi:hypothetical protein